MTKFHDEEYINFLNLVSPSFVKEVEEKRRTEQTKFKNECGKYHIGISEAMDNPIFDGMYDFSALSAGASLAGARKLGKNECDIAINWAGGLHHAMKGHAHGFCYVNDGVLGIIELLDRGYRRVLYVDIDVHHGDGVEKAFEDTDRVMTVSFHKYGAVRGHPFFPGTGALGDIGQGEGKNYSINIPLKDGINSEAYGHVFSRVITEVQKHYDASAIGVYQELYMCGCRLTFFPVLQCGADSLAGDRLGNFNLDMKGHANCISFVKGLGRPLLVLGGGGYQVGNSSKTWAYETGVLVGEELAPKIPLNLSSYAVSVSFLYKCTK